MHSADVDLDPPSPKRQGDHVRRVRADLPVVSEYAYLNTGTCGPLPQPAITAMAAAAADQARVGRIRAEGYHQQQEVMESLRMAFARLMGARLSQIALTHSTTEGLNIAVWGQPWRQGDEIVITDLEHEGGVVPAYLVAQRFDLNVRTLNLVDADPDDYANIVADNLSDQSRLLVISHVSWSNGALVPLKDVVAAAHARGCQVAVDAAQSAGAIALDLPATGVDYYAVSGQKWLCGPEGIGALYVSDRVLDDLQPTFSGGLALDFKNHPLPWDFSGHMNPFPTARRFEAITVYPPAAPGMLASLTWLDQVVGWEWAFERIGAMREYTRQRLMQNPMLRVFTPSGGAGLVHFYLPAQADPEAVNTALSERDIRIRTIPHMHCLRISTGFWNTEAEIDGLTQALKEILG